MKQLILYNCKIYIYMLQIFLHLNRIFYRQKNIKSVRQFFTNQFQNMQNIYVFSYFRIHLL